MASPVKNILDEFAQPVVEPQTDVSAILAEFNDAQLSSQPAASTDVSAILTEMAPKPRAPSPEMQALRDESLARQQGGDTKQKRMMNNDDGDCYLCDYYERMEVDNNRVATKTTERQQGIEKRKYLTQPPDEYNVPAETAEVGVVGETESADGSEAKKKKKLFDGGLFE